MTGQRSWQMELALVFALVLSTLGISFSCVHAAPTQTEKPPEGRKAGETEHFFYRLQPADGPTIDSQRGNKAFGFTNERILLSEDNGRTWPHSAEFADTGLITFSYILKNGNVLFATERKLYLSTDNLKTHRQITVKDRDGSDYIPHKPKNPHHGGFYFHPYQGVISWPVHGKEMLLWGNYCNVWDGASPVNIYYSTDGGETVKIAYSFGQNPNHRDNGRGWPGGGKTGTLLGDPDNPLYTRHVHSTAYNPAEDAFYACTGDGPKQVHWLRGVYDHESDTWQWKVIMRDAGEARYKAGGIHFVDGQLYWASDSMAPESEQGIFRCDPGDIADPKKHTRLFNPKVETASMIIEDGVIMAGHLTPRSPLDTGIIYSPDMGKTWAQHDLKELGKHSAVQFHARNGEGWFRVDLRHRWGRKLNDVLFIKPKGEAKQK